MLICQYFPSYLLHGVADDFGYETHGSLIDVNNRGDYLVVKLGNCVALISDNFTSNVDEWLRRSPECAVHYHKLGLQYYHLHQHPIVLHRVIVDAKAGDHNELFALCDKPVHLFNEITTCQCYTVLETGPYWLLRMVLDPLPMLRLGAPMLK